jgi:hypothetical protein
MFDCGRLLTVGLVAVAVKRTSLATAPVMARLLKVAMPSENVTDVVPVRLTLVPDAKNRLAVPDEFAPVVMVFPSLSRTRITTGLEKVTPTRSTLLGCCTYATAMAVPCVRVSDWVAWVMLDELAPVTL